MQKRKKGGKIVPQFTFSEFLFIGKNLYWATFYQLDLVMGTASRPVSFQRGSDLLPRAFFLHFLSLL